MVEETDSGLSFQRCLEAVTQNWTPQNAASPAMTSKQLPKLEKEHCLYMHCTKEMELHAFFSYCVTQFWKRASDWQYLDHKQKALQLPWYNLR